MFGHEAQGCNPVFLFFIYIFFKKTSFTVQNCRAFVTVSMPFLYFLQQLALAAFTASQYTILALLLMYLFILLE